MKRIYQITIDKGFARQIVGIAKQQYGGDLDLAIRTREVKDLLELYAMSRGQSPSGLGNMRPQAISLVRGGSGLFQAPSFSNGSVLPSLSGLPSLGVASGQPITIVVQNQLPAEAVGDYMRGEVVETVKKMYPESFRAP